MFSDLIIRLIIRLRDRQQRREREQHRATERRPSATGPQERERSFTLKITGVSLRVLAPPHTLLLISREVRGAVTPSDPELEIML